MSMETFHTLTQLLDNAGCRYNIFDLGRRVNEINSDQFKAVEENRQPYPWPLQQHAHIAISFWQHQQPPWVWFLRLPLDERGLLKQAAVGDFIKYVIEAMGASLNTTPTEEEQQKLANNPYTFKPNDDKMAIFNAQLRVLLNLPASQYYADAQAYLADQQDWQQWQHIGLQGLADICARMSQHNNATYLRKALNHLPMTPLYALLGCLEHCSLPEPLVLRITERLTVECQQQHPDLFLIAALVRALAGSKPQQLQYTLTTLLNQPSLCHPEVLVAIAGRCWSGFTDTNIASLFLLRLAETQDQTLFNQLFTDLVMQPLLRGIMLQILHGQADPALIDAIQKLQHHAKNH